MDTDGWHNGDLNLALYRRLIRLDAYLLNSIYEQSVCLDVFVYIWVSVAG